MKRALVLVLLAGCDSILGLGGTKFTGGDAQMPDAPRQPDACATCGTFTSCKALKTMQPSAPSGVYNIGTFSAYCDQTGDGGGWTLALKIDGRNQTFVYSDPIWESSTLLNESMPAFDHTEAKLDTFNKIAFTELRIGMEYPVESGTIHYLVVPVAANQLRDLFVGNVTLETTLGRDAWKGLMGPTGSLQPNCNREGINIFEPTGGTATSVRIGIISNEQEDCLSPDSRIGVGGGYTPVCDPVPDVQTAGNSSCYGSDNGDIEAAAFAWVFVR